MGHSTRTQPSLAVPALILTLFVLQNQAYNVLFNDVYKLQQLKNIGEGLCYEALRKCC